MKNIVNCEICGKEIEPKVYKYGNSRCVAKVKQGRKYCSRECMGKAKSVEYLGKRTGPENASWKGGTTIDKRGYVYERVPRHPFVQQNCYVAKHRLVMEAHLKRYLDPEESVHHVDGNTSNNELSNLMLFPNEGAHQKYHWLFKPETKIEVECRTCGQKYKVKKSRVKKTKYCSYKCAGRRRRKKK